MLSSQDVISSQVVMSYRVVAPSVTSSACAGCSTRRRVWTLCSVPRINILLSRYANYLRDIVKEAHYFSIYLFIFNV